MALPNRAFRLHPVLLDAALQGLAAAMPPAALADAADATVLPVSIESVRVFAPVGRRARCRAELVSFADNGADAIGRVMLTDESGTPTAELTGVYLRRVQRRTVPLPLEQKIFDTTWVPTPAPASSGPAHGSWLALGHDDAGTALAERFARQLDGPEHRVITADLGDEAAVVQAFAITAGDAARPPVGVVAFVDTAAFDPADVTGASARARDLIWKAAVAVRAVSYTHLTLPTN